MERQCGPRCCRQPALRPALREAFLHSPQRRRHFMSRPKAMTIIPAPRLLHLRRCPGRSERLARRGSTSEPVKVVMLEGTYYLETPLAFRSQDSGANGAPVMFAAETGHRVTISGGRKLACDWKPYQNGIMMTDVPAGLEFTQLFVNGKRQIRARYPNYDPSVPGKSGYLLAAGAIPHDAANPFAGPDEDMTFSTEAPRGIRFDPATFSRKKWSSLQDAEIHIFQAAYWGNLHWKIKGIDLASNSIWFGEGGQQIGAKWSDNPGVLSRKSLILHRQRVGRARRARGMVSRQEEKYSLPLP